MNELYASMADHSERRVLKRYASYDCLLIDEVGYADIEPAQVSLFFTLMHKRHKVKPTLITTNLGLPINMRNCKSLRPKSDDQSDSA